MTLAIAAEAALVVLQLRWRRESQRLRAWCAPSSRATGCRGRLGRSSRLSPSASPLGTLELLLVLLFLGLTFVGVTTLSWMLDAWRDAYSIDATGFPEPTGEPRLSFSLIVPARHEEAVLGATLSAARRARTIPTSRSSSSSATTTPAPAAVARRGSRARPAGLASSSITTRSRTSRRRSTRALPECRGDIVGVFDAEDVSRRACSASSTPASRSGRRRRAGRRRSS